MAKRRDPLPRLSIAPNLNMQQPMGGPGGGFYSPPSPPASNRASTPLSLPQTLSRHQCSPSSRGPQAHRGAQPTMPTRPASSSRQRAYTRPASATPVATHFPRPSVVLAPGGQPHAPRPPVSEPESPPAEHRGATQGRPWGPCAQGQSYARRNP